MDLPLLLFNPEMTGNARRPETAGPPPDTLCERAEAAILQALFSAAQG
ncbi:hypothetical protein I6G56_24100 [Burkholderia humptydooensis]|uniref:Uncharacterized protein n=1 Tax=Burkholderia humptydooensis TaxID=430531 RepID=A0A7T2U8F2_9BURK|nr:MULTISPECIES: hypothetical protein [Burkholderia]QPS47508.1 hypothetical protein I6G56_24100 [Burkholderia humptydooensis]